MSVVHVVEPRATVVGRTPIRRLLPSLRRKMVGPFTFMDQGGPLTVPNRPGGGVPEHPHAGLSTFTYLMAGTMMHRDSAGHSARIASGDIALMTAGSGITHEELADPTDTAPSHTVHFAQMWLALPDALEEMAPAFEHHAKDALPVVRRAGSTVRLAMGTGWGATAPTTCHMPTLFAELRLEPGAALDIPAGYDEQALMLLDGDARVGADVLKPHHVSVLAGTDATLTSEHGAHLLMFGGERFPRRRWMGGPFVASSPAKLKRWMLDSAEGRWPRIAR